jgi:hypothetical protein
MQIQDATVYTERPTGRFVEVEVGIIGMHLTTAPVSGVIIFAFTIHSSIYIRPLKDCGMRRIC